MREVVVSYVVELDAAEILDDLTPERIVDAAELYDLESVTEKQNTQRVTVRFDDEHLVYEFSEREDGYEYELADSTGLFAERRSTLTVEQTTQTEITAETIFTLDTRWSFILDRFAGSTIEEELQRTIENLVSDVSETA